MAFEKKQTFYVVIGEDGARDITDFLPVNSGRLERTIEATSERAAYKEALGELPKQSRHQGACDSAERDPWHQDVVLM